MPQLLAALGTPRCSQPQEGPRFVMSPNPSSDPSVSRSSQQQGGNPRLPGGKDIPERTAKGGGSSSRAGPA